MGNIGDPIRPDPLQERWHGEPILADWLMIDCMILDFKSNLGRILVGLRGLLWLAFGPLKQHLGDSHRRNILDFEAVEPGDSAPR